MSTKTVGSNRWANICVSECEGMLALGRDTHEFNNLICKFSDFLLNRGFRLVFGHDWREDGVMRAVATIAEETTGEYHKQMDADFPRMLNVVPAPMSKVNELGVRAAEESGGVLEIVSLMDLSRSEGRLGKRDWYSRLSSDPVCRDMLPKAMLDDAIYRNWMLRYALTVVGRDGMRVCLGGKTSGYTGYYAGLAEEALFALEHGIPLYLVGGFGGATAEIAKCFSGKPGTLYTDPGGTAPLEPAKLEEPLSHEAEALAKRIGMPLGGLAPFFESKGMQALCDNNGLQKADNEKLFRTTDIEVALHLIERGLQRSK